MSRDINEADIADLYGACGQCDDCGCASAITNLKALIQRLVYAYGDCHMCEVMGTRLTPAQRRQHETTINLATNVLSIVDPIHPMGNDECSK